MAGLELSEAEGYFPVNSDERAFVAPRCSKSLSGRDLSFSDVHAASSSLLAFIRDHDDIVWSTRMDHQVQIQT